MTQSYFHRVKSARDPVFWETWAKHALLILASVHLLAGVVFFFAFNWDDLSAPGKFMLLQCVIVFSLLGALMARLDRIAGQALLITASVVTGVLLAVIGQVYQTGADAWQLFAAWTALILPWVAVSRNSVHVFLWVVLLLTATTLYGEQYLVALGHIDRYQLITLIGILTFVLLLIRELVVKAGCHWISAAWFRRLLIILLFTSLIVPALSFVFEARASALPGFIAFTLLIAGSVFCYAHWFDDFPSVSLTIAFATLFTMASGGHMIFELLDFNDDIGSLVLPLLLLAGWCVLITSIMVRLLRLVYAWIEQRQTSE